MHCLSIARPWANAPVGATQMLTDCALEDARWKAADLSRLAERAARATLSELSLPPDRFEIAVLGCRDSRIADLNADFRGKPVPTNVLSWPSEERGADKDGEMPDLPHPRPGDIVELGDIAIAFDTCQREAADTGISLAAHASHLIVHGTLHLLGYDHERDRDATLMETLERRILGKMGIADPYSATPPATGGVKGKG